MKRIILALACVGLAGGVASADHGRGGGRGQWHGGGSHGEFHGRGEWHGGGGEWHGGGGEWHGGNRWQGGVHVNGGYRYARPVYNSGYRYNYVRQPIYVQRPIIRQHYYDYRYRPELLVENYGARPGYYWVNGSWQWTGYEWTWYPGHYQPDPSYVDPGYSYSYGTYDDDDYDGDGD